MKIPPGTPRSRSLTRFTMRVDLPHLGQSVLLDVSITFLRSAVLAILAMFSPKIYFTRGVRKLSFRPSVLTTFVISSAPAREESAFPGQHHKCYQQTADSSGASRPS